VLLGGERGSSPSRERGRILPFALKEGGSGEAYRGVRSSLFLIHLKGRHLQKESADSVRYSGKRVSFFETVRRERYSFVVEGTDLSVRGATRRGATQIPSGGRRKSLDEEGGSRLDL